MITKHFLVIRAFLFCSKSVIIYKQNSIYLKGAIE